MYYYVFLSLVLQMYVKVGRNNVKINRMNAKVGRMHVKIGRMLVKSRIM